MYAYASVKEYANLLRLTSFRGKALDWIKFETQNKKKNESKGRHILCPIRWTEGGDALGI